MTRQQIENGILRHLQPLGPLGSIEEREEAREAWIASATAGWLPILWDLVVHPPDSIIDTYRRDEWNFIMWSILGRSGGLAPQQFFACAQALLVRHVEVEIILTAIAATGHPDSVRQLRLAYQMIRLSDEETSWLVGSLLDVNTDEAFELIRKIKHDVRNSNMPETKKLIETALAELESKK